MRSAWFARVSRYRKLTEENIARAAATRSASERVRHTRLAERYLRLAEIELKVAESRRAPGRVSRRA